MINKKNNKEKVELDVKESTGMPSPALDSSAFKQLPDGLYFWT